ncbi:predicted protein [Uncinocarpus reesii 1704]|uniref:Uncharacterized protein n=1 Tax=Uncinocarpus reesii (strain UAMH 1704) TaxID=336963 RepID=C4JLN0_UNCRE|nr:uncharacterized protein UREG_03738 [Uncinocarpus reesii 1704]EEP78892.1 predicted protein [Uncinocarpus reesii 1704]
MSHPTLQNIKQIALQNLNLTSEASGASAAGANVARDVNKSVNSVESEDQLMEIQQHELLNSDSNNNDEIDLISTLDADDKENLLDNEFQLQNIIKEVIVDIKQSTIKKLLEPEPEPESNTNVPVNLLELSTLEDEFLEALLNIRAKKYEQMKSFAMVFAL